MKLFTINKSGKLIPYKEHDFKDFKQETDLEVLLENNPECFFKESKVLIIGCLFACATKKPENLS